MKKSNVSSDKRKSGDGFLPAETIWRAAQMIYQKGKEIPPIDAEPAPLEILGLAIGVLRRRNHISRLQFVRKIGCSMEELLALEAGLLPAGELAKYLQLILKEINMPELSLNALFRNIKFV